MSKYQGLHFQDAIAVTKSDTTRYDPPLDAIYIGGTGNLAVETLGGNIVTFATIAASTVLPIRAIRVMSTDTTATTIVGLVMGAIPTVKQVAAATAVTEYITRAGNAIVERSTANIIARS